MYRSLIIVFIVLLAVAVYALRTRNVIANPETPPAATQIAEAAPEPTPAPAPTPAAEPAPTSVRTVVKLAPGPEIQTQVQEALILAEPGTTFEFAEGRYEFTMGLSLDVDNCTVRGAGQDKTVFDFSQQDAGSEGLLVTSNNVVLEDFAIENAKGNCFKSNAANQLTLRRVRAEWTGGPKETNGAYGLYPVGGRDILIEDSIVRGASDAGIYVGQSENIIVRRNSVEINVAGIEIENCHFADVYENACTKNTGGVLVFDLPGLPKQRGQGVRVFNNKIYDNNTPNFAPAGNIVAKVPTGTGVMIMSNSNVHVFNNDVRDHGTMNLLLCSYLVSGNKIKDPNYYPYPEGIYIHDNVFGACGNAPAGEFGKLAASIAGPVLPDIVWDGVVNPEKLVDGQLPKELRLYIENNTKDGDGEVGFVNVDASAFIANPLTASVKRDISVHAGQLPPLPPIEIAGIN